LGQSPRIGRSVVEREKIIRDRRKNLKGKISYVIEKWNARKKDKNSKKVANEIYVRSLGFAVTEKGKGARNLAI